MVYHVHDWCEGRSGDVPLPVRSMYQTLRESSMKNIPSRPFGERLMWPSRDSGAVATQKTFCLGIQAMRKSGISSKN